VLFTSDFDDGPASRFKLIGLDSFHNIFSNGKIILKNNNNMQLLPAALVHLLIDSSNQI